MNTTPITINSNRLSCRIELTEAEDYFVSRYIWPAITSEGKDAEISEQVPLTANYAHNRIDIEMACTKETTAMEAYDSILAYANKVKEEISTALNKYYAVREQWEPTLTMTLKALGLVAI